MKLCIVAITLLLAGCGSVVTVGQRFVGEYDHVYETTYLKDDPEDGIDRWFECQDCGFKFLPEAEA